jgi:hypothetical protein
VKKAVVQRFHLDEGLDPGDPHFGLQKERELHRFLGYEVFRVPVIHKAFFKMASVNTRGRAPKLPTKRGGPICSTTVGISKTSWRPSSKRLASMPGTPSRMPSCL